jgi:subtilisin family serine protease
MKKTAKTFCLLFVFTLFSCVEIDDNDNQSGCRGDNGSATQIFALQSPQPEPYVNPDDFPSSDIDLPAFCLQLDPSIFAKVNPEDLTPRPDFPLAETTSASPSNSASPSSPPPATLALTPDKKLTYSVRNNLFGPWNKKPTGEIGLAVQFWPDVALSEGETIVKKYGGTFEGKIKLLNVILTAIPEEKKDDFYKIRHESAVRAVDIWPARLESDNDRVRRTAGVDKMRITYPGYDGSGVIVGVYDAGAVCQHPDFAGRLIVADDDYCADHATHVAGTTGGSGAYSQEWGRLMGKDVEPFQFMGVAPGVQIVSYSLGACDNSFWGSCLYNDPGDIEEDFREMISVYGVDIAGMSLGVNVARNYQPCEWEGDTCLTSILLDTIVYLQDLICTLSASNERSPYYYHRCGDGYGTSSPPASGSKDCNIVAASDQYGAPTNFTGWSPEDDGRIGITGCIKGDGVWSTVPTWNGFGYDEMSGTSMSRPAMTGVIALMIQVFYEKHDERPSPSLAKAIIVNSLEESPGTPYGPDFQCGFGVMSEFSTLEVVETVRQERFIEGVIQNGGIKNYLLVKNSDTQEVRVTLAWTDKPGSLERQEMGLPQLVNDLDLTVNGRKPLVPDPAYPDNGATETEDHLNNVEQVLITEPHTKCFIVTVRGYNVPEGPQKFSLAFSGAYAWPPKFDPDIIRGTAVDVDKLKTGGKVHLPPDGG